MTLKLKEIEKKIKIASEILDDNEYYSTLGQTKSFISEIKKLEAELKRLREGIKKHMNNTNRDYNYLDEELYKLLDGDK